MLGGRKLGFKSFNKSRKLLMLTDILLAASQLMPPIYEARAHGPWTAAPKPLVQWEEEHPSSLQKSASNRSQQGGGTYSIPNPFSRSHIRNRRRQKWYLRRNSIRSITEPSRLLLRNSLRFDISFYHRCHFLFMIFRYQLFSRNHKLCFKT